MATNNGINAPTNAFAQNANNLSDLASTNTALYNLRNTGDNVVAVSTGTVLTATNCGQKILCTGSSAFTLTLPAVGLVPVRYIDIQSLTGSSALITIAPAGGVLIAGQSNFVLGSGESCRVWTDGNNWYIAEYFPMPVNCSVYASTNQTGITTATKVQLNTKLFDVGGYFDATTNFRYTPLYPGKYQINLTINGGPGISAITNGQLYKNGSVINIAQSTAIASAGTATSLVIPVIVLMNGTTDYLEAFFTANAASNVNGGSSLTFFTAHRISNF